MIPHYFSQSLHAFSDKGVPPDNPEKTTQDITFRVNTLIRTCESVISVSDQNKVNDLLGRMKLLSSSKAVSTEDLDSLNNSCLVLEAYITQVLDTVKEMPVLKFKLASEALMKEPDDIQAILKEFNITDEQERVALIRIAIGMGASISNNFQSFNITNEQDRIALAQLVASREPTANDLCKHIKKYNITDEKERFTIAKLAVPIIGYRIFEFLNNFELTRAHRSEILALVADNLGPVGYDFDYELLVVGMHHLLQHERSDILKKFAERSSELGYGAFNIQDDHFLPIIRDANLNDRIELAKAIAANKNLLAVFDIKMFNIPNEDNRVEILKIYIQTHANYQLSDEIENYDIRDQANLISLAEFCAKYLSSFSIKNFDIKDENQRAAIAKIEAQNHGRVNNIKEYDLSNHDDLFAIAKLAASYRGTNIAQQIDEFNITDPQELMEIARIAAMNKGMNLLANLNKFCKRDLKKRDEIITIVARVGGYYGFHDLSNLRCLNHDEILRFLKTYASSGHRVVGSGAANIGIIFHSTRVPPQISSEEIAEVVAEQNGLDFAHGYNLFPVYNTDTLSRLLVIALKNSPSNSKEIVEEMVHNVAYHRSDYNMDDSYYPYDAIGGILNEQIDKENSAEPDVKEKCRAWLNHFGWMCQIFNKSYAEMKDLLPFAEEILRYEDPELRYALMIIPLIHKMPPHADKQAQLFHMLLSPLFEETGITKEEQEKIWNVLKSKDYKDSVKREKTIRGLCSLWSCQSLSPNEKARLLKHIFQVEQPKPQEKSKHKTKDQYLPAYDALQMLESILSSGQAELLKTEGPQASKETDEKSVKEGAVRISTLKEPIDIQAAVQQCFTKIIGLEAIPNFNQRYAETIGSDQTRNRLALLIYGAKLGSLSGEAREKALQTLKEFTQSVLEGRYSEWRYQPNKKARHFDFVTQNRPQLKAEWIKGERLALSELQAQSAKEKLKKEADVKSAAPASYAFDVFKHLKERANHFPINLPHLKQYFDDPKTALEKANKIISENKLPQKAKYEANNKKTAKVFEAKLEVFLIKLMDPNIPAKNKIGEIDRMLPLLLQICGEGQFAQDIRELKGYLAAESQTKAKEDSGRKYIIEDTDHWEDMLLCGTEVTGSCQRISGSVNLNKCLLGYLADPKNREIVVKDAKTGKIVARRIMRLLWDNTTAQPVLFRERLYHNPGVPPEALQAIDLMFERRAKQLQVPLVHSSESKDDKAYPNDLFSFGSPSPFEYVDAGLVGSTKGDYVIPAQFIAEN